MLQLIVLLLEGFILNVLEDRRLSVVQLCNTDRTDCAAFTWRLAVRWFFVPFFLYQIV